MARRHRAPHCSADPTFRVQRTGFRQSRCDRSTILARARFQPCYCHLHEVQTASGANRPSVTIRPPIPTPVQRVTRISAETDDLAKSGSAKLGTEVQRSRKAFAQACPCPAHGPGRPGPAARSQHYLFHGFQLTNKVTKRPKDKSMCAGRDAIAQRCSPGLASNRANRQTLEPLHGTYIRCGPTHPSPSAC